MIHLPFRFLSASNSQPHSVAQEALHSSVTGNAKKQQRINWVLGALSMGWAGILVGCGSSSTVSTLGDWTKRSAFEGIGRSGASSFVINNIAYLGTGLDVNNQRLQDFWAYDPAKNAWSQKANYGGVARYQGTGFAIGNKGYMGTGINVNSDKLKDFWSYDPNTNAWTKVADFGGTARYGTMAFAIGSKGYVATGNDGNYLKDMWSFDPTANAWTKVASYGGEKRVGGIAFVIDGKAYAGTGNNNGIAQRDWYVYDPAADTWTQKLDFLSDQSVQRSYGVGFTINGKGYVALGDNTQVWQYTPASDTWTQLGSFEGAGRQNAVGFAIGNKGYVTTGSASGTSRFDDLWDFDPTIEQVIN